MKNIILYGAGETGKKAVEKYGIDNIAYFCDTNKAGGSIDGIPVIDVATLKKIHSDYRVIVTPERWNCLGQICDTLEQMNIPFEHFANPRHLLHIFGKFPELKYECMTDEKDILYFRCVETTKLYKYMFAQNAEEFKNKEVDIWIYYGDMIELAATAADIRNLKHIFCYSTSPAYEGFVIPIPDYRSCFDVEQYLYKETQELCAESAAKPYEVNKAFWIGTVPTDPGRQALFRMGQRYPDRLEIFDSSDKEHPHFVPMLEQSKYKYLFDLRGLGWSDRTKILLQLGRPLLYIDRPYAEYFTKALIPMKHYIPIKEDLSDLFEKMDYVEAHPEVYSDIINNVKKIVEEYLSPEGIVNYLKEATLQYGVI